jgi:hypothetical protein
MTPNNNRVVSFHANTLHRFVSRKHFLRYYLQTSTEKKRRVEKDEM